jgi:hypothetical protein
MNDVKSVLIMVVSGVLSLLSPIEKLPIVKWWQEGGERMIYCDERQDRAHSQRVEVLTQSNF